MPITVDVKNCTITDLAMLVTLLVACEVERCGLKKFNRMLEESNLNGKIKVTEREN